MEKGRLWARRGGAVTCRQLLEFSHPAVIGLKWNPRSLELDEILGIIQFIFILSVRDTYGVSRAYLRPEK